MTAHIAETTQEWLRDKSQSLSDPTQKLLNLIEHLWWDVKMTVPI